MSGGAYKHFLANRNAAVIVHTISKSIVDRLFYFVSKIYPWDVIYESGE